MQRTGESLRIVGASEIAEILKKKAAYVSGGFDKKGRLLISIPQSGNDFFDVHRELKATLPFLVSHYRGTAGWQMAVIIDNRKYNIDWLKQVLMSLNNIRESISDVYILFPRKRRMKKKVDNSWTELQVHVVTLGILVQYIDVDELTKEFGGNRCYDHNDWLKKKLIVERHSKETSAVLRHIDVSCGFLLALPDQVSESIVRKALNRGEEIFNKSLEIPQKSIKNGEELTNVLKEDPDTGFPGFETFYERDIQTVEECKHKIQEKVKNFEVLWKDKKQGMKRFLDFSEWEKNVGKVIAGIDCYQKVLDSHLKIGETITECKDLLHQHDQLELACADIYVNFAILTHQATELKDDFPSLGQKNSTLKECLVTSCFKFADKLDKRKTILQHSSKFHLVLEQFSEFLAGAHKFIDNFAESETQEKVGQLIQETIELKDQLYSMIGGVLSEGLALSDLTHDSFYPIAIRNSQQEHICNWLGFADARREIIENDLEFFRLRLLYNQQIIRCEEEASQSSQWLDDLSGIITSDAFPIGNGQKEVELNIVTHIKMQKTARDSYDCGRKLLSTALHLRKKSSLATRRNAHLASKLFFSWQALLSRSHEKTKRLEACLKFYERISKVQRKMETMKSTLERNLVLFGQIRKRFVVQKQKKSWNNISEELQKCFQLEKVIRHQLSIPISKCGRSQKSDEKVPEGIHHSLAAAQEAAASMQQAYFDDDGDSPSSISDFKSAMSWKSTSISGFDEWCSCSVTSNGTTADDWRSVDEDIPEEWVEDEASAEMHDSNSDSEDSQKRFKVASAIPIKDELPANTKTYFAKQTIAQVSGVEKSTTEPQTVSPEPVAYVAVAKVHEPAIAKVKKSAEQIIRVDVESTEPVDRVYSPKAATPYEPKKYAATISETKVPVQVTEKLPSSQFVDPKQDAREDILAKLESMKSRYQTTGFEPPRDVKLPETKTQTSESSSKISHGWISGPTVSDIPKDTAGTDIKDKAEISRVSYSKETTETRTMTRISYEQQTLGYKPSGDPEELKIRKVIPISSSAESYEIPITKEIITDDWISERMALDKRLMQSKEWIQLKIQEMHPSMTDIGTNLADAVELNQQHEKVLEKLQTKQSPVEELLRQADELIASQKPRGEVYSAMAENLGLAWKDLNAQLEQRRQILEQAVVFFTRSKDFNDILDRIQKNLADGYLPDSADLCSTVMQRHQEERKVALSCSMHVLKEGQLLMERLVEVATHSMGDSRPFHMQHAARQTSNFVERHMEALHDRWRHLEALWMQRKLKLEQCLRKCQFLAELNEVESWLSTKGNQYAMERNLGDSLASAEILQHEHTKTEKEAKDKQDETLKLVRTAEQLAHAGNYAGEDIKAKAYETLSDCSELLNVLESRSLLLSIAVVFFNSAQTALNKFDQIELQLTTSETIPSQQSHLNIAVEEVTSAAIEEGHNLIAKVGSHEPGAQGIVKKVAELEKRRMFLLELWHASLAENSERAAAFRNFNNSYSQLLTWIRNSGQGFLQRNRDMGSTQMSAKSFVDQHEVVQNDFQVKGIEIESLLSTVSSLVQVGGSNAQEVLKKAEHLREQCHQLKMMLDKRLLIGHSYLAFHKLASKVKKGIADLESEVRKVCEGASDANSRAVEEKLLTLQQETLQMKNSGRNFLEDAGKVEEIYLNMSIPCNAVRNILDDIDSRKMNLTTQWTNWQNQMSTNREALIQWEHLVKDSHRVIKCAIELESKMFPVIPKELNRVESILPFLENRMVVLLPQIKSVQQEMDNFLKKSDVLCPKDKPEPEGQKIVSELQKMNQSFQKKLTDYQILISMMTAYFKNFEELEKMVDMQESQFKMSSLPSDVTRVETLLHDHNAIRPTVLELFKFSVTESDQVIKKIDDAEPVEAAIQDKEKISSIYQLRKKSFESSWEDHRKRLEQHLQMCVFNWDMHQINQQIQDLNTQLAAMKENYGDSLPNVMMTSEAFIQFEKTIEILEVRIRNFITTAEKLMSEKKVHPAQVRKEIQSMQTKWSTFRTQVSRKRQLIEISIEYYKLVEECEEWLKDGSRVLMSIARQSSVCKSTSDANSLNKEIQTFLNKGKNNQEERMKKLSSLSMQLYGPSGHPSIQHVTSKNKDMFDSFTMICSELHVLIENIKTAEKEKIKEAKEKEEMDAALHAAQAEAEAARMAALQAQAAAKAAEAAVKAAPVPKPVPAIAVIHQPPRFTIPLTDAEVAEGTKVVLECKVEGHPQPQIQWFKDGILAETNPDYQTKFQNGICTLTIEETFSEDTARFTCRASNASGVAETHGKLLVKESRPPDGLIPPHFITEPKDAVVVEGGLHRFECQVSGNPLPLISWFKDDACIDSSTDYSLMYNNGYCTLCLEETAVDHAGKYTCRALNQAGQVACSVTLQVQTSVPMEKPIFVTPLSNVMARAGQKLRLECAVTGQPEPQITWLQNSKAIKETRDIKMHFDGHKATLVITEAFPKDAGVYSIVARNKAGEAVSTCNVSVKGRLPLETSDSEMASDIEPAKPQVKQHLDDQTVTEGNKVRMDCIIVGQPEPEVIWYHNGKPVKESDDFQLLFEGDRCTLVIKVAYLEDAGIYKCVAINSGGEASSQCQLFIKAAPEAVDKNHLSKKEIVLNVEKPKPPKFIRLLKDVATPEGHPIKLECQVVGEPEIEIKWFKNGEEIHSSKDFGIKEEANGTTSLHIFNVKPVHSGSFSVTAQDKGGEANTFCSLTVTPAPVRQITIPESPPVFLQNIEENRVTDGQPAKFESIVIGTPKPTVRWNFQGKSINTDKDHQLGEDGDKKWLVIRSVAKDHNGRYSIVAENNSGIATSSALLHVEEPFEHISTDTFYEQKAQTMVMAKKTTIVEKCTISSMSEVVDSPPPPLEPVPSKIMLPKAAPSVPEIVRTESSALATTIIPAKVLIPPKFTQPLSANLVTEGEKLFLEAYIEGDPEPTIQWFKDGIERHSKPDCVILRGAGRASLSIPKAVESDSGRYSCVGSNDAGKATSMAEVKVKPYRESPKFLKRLQANVVKSGARIHFEIEVSGVPPPEVKWYRNGGAIDDSPDFRITKDGNKHSLLISEVFPDDSGLFMVTAHNLAGEAKCLADLIVEDDRSPEEEKVINYQQISSMEQKREVFTKVSTAPPVTVEPYKQLPVEPKVEVLPKTPSPPPIPAIISKVWSQTKPESFTPKIEQVLSVQDLPMVEVPEEPIVQPTQIDEATKSTSTSSIAPFSSVQSHSFVKQTVMKFSDHQQSDQSLPSAALKEHTVDHPKPEMMSSDTKPLSIPNGIDQKQEIYSSVKKETSQFSQSFVSTSSTTEKFMPVKFPPKPLESTKSTPVWSPEPSVKTSWKPVHPPTQASPVEPVLASADITQYQDLTITPVSETKVLSDDTTSRFYSSSSTTSMHQSVTRITKEETSETSHYEEVTSQQKVASTDSKPEHVPKPIIKKKDTQVADGPKPKKAVVIEEEPVVGTEVKPPVFSKVRGAECLWKIT